MKSCQNCIYFKLDVASKYYGGYAPSPHICMHEAARYISQSIIYEEVLNYTCEGMRQKHGDCGPEAKLFKPKLFYKLKTLLS
jgi:hypothetical protein